MEFRGLLLTVILTGLFLSCQSPKPLEIGPTDSKIVANRHAQLFQLSTIESDTFLHIYGSRKRIIARYFWGKSEHIAAHQKIYRKPSVVALSALFARMLHELELGQSLVGVDNLDYLPTEISRSAGCKSVQKTGILNQEALVNMKAAVVFCYLLDGTGESEWLRLQRDSQAVVFIQSHLESHPLARAEWIRAMGWLLGRAAYSDSLFQDIEMRYLNLCKQSDTLKDNPNTMLNLPFQGIWHIPNRDAYFTQLLRDAGLNPVWLNPKSHPGTGASTLSLEQAIVHVQSAEIWLNLGAAKSKADIADYEPRLLNLVQNKKLRCYQNDRLLEANGANAFWDLGALHPERILSDLLTIRKSGPDKDLYFYRAL